MTNHVTAIRDALGLAQARQIIPAYNGTPRAWHIQATKNIQQCALARTGSTNNSHHLARNYFEVEPLESYDLQISNLINFNQIITGNNCLRHSYSSIFLRDVSRGKREKQYAPLKPLYPVYLVGAQTQRIAYRGA